MFTHQSFIQCDFFYWWFHVWFSMICVFFPSKNISPSFFLFQSNESVDEQWMKFWSFKKRQKKKKELKPKTSFLLQAIVSKWGEQIIELFIDFGSTILQLVFSIKNVTKSLLLLLFPFLLCFGFFLLFRIRIYSNTKR